MKKTEVLTIRISPEDKKTIQRVAKMEYRSVANMIIHALCFKWGIDMTIAERKINDAIAKKNRKRTRYNHTNRTSRKDRSIV